MSSPREILPTFRMALHSWNVVELFKTEQKSVFIQSYDRTKETNGVCPLSSKKLSRREYLSITELSAFLQGVTSDNERSIQRVRELIQAIVAATFPGDPEPDQKTWNAADKKANRLLAAYTAIPELCRDDEGYGFIEQNIFAPAGEALDWQEASAVRQVIYLSNEGVLHQLIACATCAAFFLPKRTDQRNCGSACSKKAYESGPEFRDKRNRWSRDHYRK